MNDMNETGMAFLFILAIVGLSAILGVVFRGLEKEEKDRDNILMTLLRGFGMLFVIVFILSSVGGIIYLIYSLFS